MEIDKLGTVSKEVDVEEFKQYRWIKSVAEH